MADRSLEEQVARVLDPAVWMLFDVAGRDGFADSKIGEVALFRDRRRATLAIADEIIDLVGGDIEERIIELVKNRAVPPIANELEQLIAAEFKRKVTAAARGSRAVDVTMADVG